MKKYVENMKEYVKNMKTYVENMKEYEEICRRIGFGTPISIWALGLGKIPNPPPLYGPWDLENFHARASTWALGLRNILSLTLGSGSSASIQALGFKKMLKQLELMMG